MTWSSLFKPKSAARKRLDEIERELKHSANLAERTKLMAEMGDLRTEIAFEDFASTVPVGPRLLTARHQLQMLDGRIAVDRLSPEIRILALIELAIHQGAPIYNEGSHIGCAYIYDCATRMILHAPPHESVKAAVERLMKVSFEPITEMGANQRAWQLRAAFDDVSAMLQRDDDHEVRVFISYRREGGAPYARMVYDRLKKDLGERVFLDIECIGCGERFRERLKLETDACTVIVVMIDRGWHGPAPDGSQRIDQEDDLVRLEVETALRRGIRIVPVLVGGASMPVATELPTGLKALPEFQHVEVSNIRVKEDLERVAQAIRR